MFYFLCPKRNNNKRFMACFPLWHNHVLDGSSVIYWNLGLQICKVHPERGGSGLKAQQITQELVSWALGLLLLLHLSSVPGAGWGWGGGGGGCRQTREEVTMEFGFAIRQPVALSRYFTMVPQK